MPALLRLDRPEPSIALLTLDRPDRKNALSIALRDEISDALDDLDGDEELKVVVITGAGNAFCAGFDLAEFDRAFEDPDFAAGLWASSDRYHRRVLQFPLPDRGGRQRACARRWLRPRGPVRPPGCLDHGSVRPSRVRLR